MVDKSKYVCMLYVLIILEEKVSENGPIFLINKKKFVQGVDFEEGNQVLRNKICQQYQYLKVRFIKLKF